MATNGTQAHSSEERFAVSSEGMRKINESREPTNLIKELIQNAWDEALFTGECNIKVEPEDDCTAITVEDNGRGFRTIADAYTLMGHTDKRMDAEKRGRFNQGEKDVISVALEATVETVGHTVTFPRNESREVAPNERQQGTVIRVTMPWNKRQADELIRNLLTFRPPSNCATYVNDVVMQRRPAVATIKATLPTVIQKDRQSPLTETRRSTEIHLVSPTNAGDDRQIYEMGIPVDTINCPWDVDVMQKIPMGQHRDTVKESYLRLIYIEVLNNAYRQMRQQEFATAWVKKAIESGRASPDAVKATVRARWSEHVVFATLNRNANARANDAGYDVINPQSLSQKEMDQFRQHAGIQDSDIVFPDPPKPQQDYPAAAGSDQAKFSEWVQEVAQHCGLDATVRYFNEPANPTLADCTAASSAPTIRFNEGRLDAGFFKPPHNGVEQYELVIHELGHALDHSQGADHGPKWGEAVGKASAMVLRGMASAPAP